MEQSDVVFIAVGTPPDEDGSADLTHVLDVADDHRPAHEPPQDRGHQEHGAGGHGREGARGHRRRTPRSPFHVASNPEFLKEGAAVQDFMKPDRIVLGVHSREAETALRELYEPFVRSGNPILFMDIPSAEVTKYAANAMLAARIALMNQFATLCERVGADVDDVRRGIGSDARIGKAFLFPGPGYGGSCFPKDVKALCATGREVGARAGHPGDGRGRATSGRSACRPRSCERALGGLAGRAVAVWGLAFKAQTDDMREAASLVVVEALLAGGASVTVHDPKAMDEARRHFGDRVRYVEHRYDALEGADALVVLTEWQEYRVLDFDRAKALMRRPVVIDARNLYEPARMRQHGFTYDSIGRA